MAIERVHFKPEGLFLKQPKNLHYYRLSSNGKTYGYLGLDLFGEKAAVHLEVVDWSLSIAKDMINTKPQFFSIVKALKVKILIASNFPENNPDKWRKFVGLFGFEDIQTIQMSTLEINHGC